MTTRKVDFQHVLAPKGCREVVGDHLGCQVRRQNGYLGAVRRGFLRGLLPDPRAQPKDARVP